MRVGRRANEATSDGRSGLSGAPGVSEFECVAGADVPNEPVLPTASNELDADPLGSVRRQTGEPLDSLESGGRRPAKSTNRASSIRKNSVGQRTTVFDQRASTNELRTTGGRRRDDQRSDGDDDRGNGSGNERVPRADRNGRHCHHCVHINVERI